MVEFKDIRPDRDGVVIAPKILAGLPLVEVVHEDARAECVRLRQKGRVPAED